MSSNAVAYYTEQLHAFIGAVVIATDACFIDDDDDDDEWICTACQTSSDALPISQRGGP